MVATGSDPTVSQVYQDTPLLVAGKLPQAFSARVRTEGALRTTARDSNAASGCVAMCVHVADDRS